MNRPGDLMKTLLAKDDREYSMREGFNVQAAIPVLKYVGWKIENGVWDDYNEFFHLCQFVEKVTSADCWVHTHTLTRSGIQTGVLLVVGGKVSKLHSISPVEDEPHTLLLKYFHMSEKGKGLGSAWLTSVVFPYYRSLNYRSMLVSSSHPASFRFYERLGKPVASFTKASDNGTQTRTGRCFEITL